MPGSAIPALEPSALWALIAAWLFDASLSEPPARLHPVVWMGACIGPFKRLAQRDLRHDVAFVLGLLLALGLPGLFATATYASERLLEPWPWLGWGVHVWLLASCFALRGLDRAAADMERALRAEDLPAARQALRSLCSRDARTLSPSQLSAGTVESLAENLHDSVVAPLLYYVLFGLPGAVFFRVVNTLDASVGYRGRFEYLGKASARLDDVLGYVPARLSVLLLRASAALVGLRPAARVSWWREARATASPNAGLPMALVGAVLGVRLEKPGEYVLGAGLGEPTVAAIAGARRVVMLAGWLTFLLGTGVLWLRGGYLVA